MHSDCDILKADGLSRCSHDNKKCGDLAKPTGTGSDSASMYREQSPTMVFTICLFISPDLDGYRAPRGINPTRPRKGL